MSPSPGPECPGVAMALDEGLVATTKKVESTTGQHGLLTVGVALAVDEEKQGGAWAVAVAGVDQSNPQWIQAGRRRRWAHPRVPVGRHRHGLQKSVALERWKR